MATKNKSKKKLNAKTSKKSKLKKAVPKKKAVAKVIARKKTLPKKKATKKAAPAKKKPVKSAAGKRGVAKTSSASRSPRSRDESRELNRPAYEPTGTRARSGGQSGDLEGLSDVADADSESVEELVEEGNAFEAEVIKGVEDTPDADEDEVHTHERLQDDVPGEYEDQ